MPHHLVVLCDVYFDPLMLGAKRIECRIGVTRKPPFECVSPGDILWFKSPSGPVRAMGQAGRCTFKQFANATALVRFLKPYLPGIQAEPEFLKRLSKRAKYVSLISIDCVVRVTPWVVRKRDQRAWLVLNGVLRPGDAVKSNIDKKRPG